MSKEESVVFIPDKSQLVDAPNADYTMDVSKFSKFSQFFSSRNLILVVLLFGPILMGVAINSIGNEAPIKEHFAVFHGYISANRSSEEKIKSFPNSIWTLGFLYPFGGWFGSLIGAIVVEKYGRRLPSFIFCVLMIIGALMKIVSRYVSIYVLFASRFFDGVATSGMMVSCVLLLFECCSPRVANVFKPFVQISINFGIVLMGLLSLEDISYVNWNFLHLTALFLSLVLALFLIIIPESPKYVYNSTRDEQKTHLLFLKLRGKYYDPQEEVELKKSISEKSNQQQMTIKQFLMEKKFRMPLISLIVLHVGQQLSGINAVMAFSPSILRSMQMRRVDIGSLIILCIGLGGSIIFAPFVANQKRKLLWLIGFISMALSFILCLVCIFAKAPNFTVILFLGAFVFMFQIGPGPVVWFISVEMFPSNATGAAQGIAGFFNWFANTLVFFFFPLLNEAMGIRVLFIFVGIQIFVIIYSFFFVVETFNKTPEEVLSEYQSLNFMCC